MTRGSGPVGPADAAEFDRAAALLRRELIAARLPEAPFATQVEVGLEAALQLLDADRDLARLLTADPSGDERNVHRRRWAWALSIGELLREASAGIPRLVGQPEYLESFLVGGTAWRVRCRLQDPPGAIAAMLPDLLQFLLSYYMAAEAVTAEVEVCRLRRLAEGSASH